MTKAQVAAVEWLQTEIFNHDCYGRPEKYEYKRFDLDFDPTTGLAFLVTEVGEINDENTVLSVLGRNHRHIVIGRKGGLELLNTGRYDKQEQRIKPTTVRARGRRVTWALTS